jgi:hypothetical protein
MSGRRLKPPKPAPFHPPSSRRNHLNCRLTLFLPLQDVLAANAEGIKLFNKWSVDDVEVKDISLTDYIQVRNAILLPHTAGRYAAKQFRKAQMPIVERLVNS